MRRTGECEVVSRDVSLRLVVTENCDDGLGRLDLAYSELDWILEVVDVSAWLSSHVFVTKYSTLQKKAVHTKDDNYYDKEIYSFKCRRIVKLTP